MKKIILLALILSSTFASADVVEFHIKKGTEQGPWNDSKTPFMGIVGDTLRFINDDIIAHQLHTYGAPCSHGPSIPAGSSWDCKASQPYSSSIDGPLYDHQFGDKAEVWIEVLK